MPTLTVDPPVVEPAANLAAALRHADVQPRPWRLANRMVHRFVNSAVVLAVPDRIYWCNGSDYERARLRDDARHPGAAGRSDVWDHPTPGVAPRPTAPTELPPFPSGHFVCTALPPVPERRDGWIDPARASAAMHRLFDGCMRGRTMYVVPFVTEMAGAPPRVAVQVTDSIRLAIAHCGRPRAGDEALRLLGTSDDFLRCIHADGDPRADRRHVCHMPYDRAVWSFGSGPCPAAAGCADCIALGLAAVGAPR